MHFRALVILQLWSEVTTDQPRTSSIIMGGSETLGGCELVPRISAFSFVKWPSCGSLRSAILGCYSMPCGQSAPQADLHQARGRQTRTSSAESWLLSFSCPSKPKPVPVLIPLGRLIWLLWFALNLPQMNPGPILKLYSSREHILPCIFWVLFTARPTN